MSPERLTTKLPEARCPNCGKVLDAVTSVFEEARPRPGDISLCIYCGVGLRFIDGQFTRAMNDFEEAQLPEDPEEVVPTLQEVNLAGNRGIPELHLDIHVYAKRPADRFVFINNRKYKEGATLQEGPTVERITRDGVLLRYQNLRFSIPRQ